MPLLSSSRGVTPLRIATATAISLLMSGPASAQFWARQPANPNGVSATRMRAPSSQPDAPPESQPDAAPADTTDDQTPPPAQQPAGPRVFIEPPTLSAPPPGPGSSLGGSGDTGTDSIGILPARDTDFGRATWRYTSFGTVLSLMQALPDRIDSAASHELAKNLLVSIADAPTGDDGGSRLLQVRVRKLLAIGNVADAAALARAAPGLPNDPALAQAEVEAELLAGQVESACIDLRSFATVLTDPTSQGALALCQQNAGETPAAPVDAAALGIAARIAGTPLTADPQTSPPANLVAVALDGGAGPELRLEAGFAAGRASALYGEFLAKLFKATPAAGISSNGGPPVSGAEAASLYQAITQEGALEQRVALAERGLLSADGISDKIGVAMVSPLRSFEPVPELGTLAPRIAILFYTVGDIDAATPWAQLADSSGTAAALWPYRVLIKQANANLVGDWEQASGLDAPHLARVKTILAAFGITAPPGGSARVAGDDRPEAPFANLLAMDKSTRDLHVGETVLRALDALGRGGPAVAHPLTLRRVLADLDQVSMHNEAHALAFEAITAALFEGRQTGGRVGAGP
jgi:hypothetical protein